MRGRRPAGIAADHSLGQDHASVFLSVSGLVGRLEPRGIDDLAFDQMVSDGAFHVAPVFRMAIVGERDAQPDEVHQREVCRKSSPGAAVHLGQEAETRARGANVTIQRIDTAEEPGSLTYRA